jgi:Tfp pilus assembly protein PilN
MRPVNLIPSEDRPGSQRPLRGGPIAYIVVGALGALLIGVIVLVLTGNQISEREAEVKTLQVETHAAEAKAQRLTAYTQFHSVREQRVATVTSLADSRFDWERVMRELALVIPGNVWLTNLAGTVTPQVTPDGEPSIALRSKVPGPALEIVGCGRDQNAVAGFIQSLKQIDGVTRVGVQSSNLGFQSGAGSSSSTTATCQTHNYIALFQVVVAFDAAPIPEVAGTEGSVPPPAPAPEESESSESTTTSSEGEG